ncbi:MAG: flagellar hook capping FlgD N-terminal domain-containing protein [Candidatus Gastranaerophilales bacterium]|nr:flagellar hook capping FlgD N-terminal domain-containing protein [Candidatus Gastranaerophilales bacterium]
MTSIGDQITAMQNATTQAQADEIKRNGYSGSSDLDGDAFLKLMLEQLKQQDPLAPIDNKEFLAQQAQFTQVTALQELNSNISVNNQVTQACMLIGKEVTLVDPEDNTKRITGVVDSASFSGSSATVNVGGKDYSLGYVVGVKTPTTTAGGESSGDTSTGTDSDKTEKS